MMVNLTNLMLRTVNVFSKTFILFLGKSCLPVPGFQEGNNNDNDHEVMICNDCNNADK